MFEKMMQKESLLCNGARVPLLKAVTCFDRLECLFHDGPPEGDGSQVVDWLRDGCLGKPLTAEQKDRLKRELFINEQGEIDPVVKQIVLSSVRGRDCFLYIDSPFVEGFDHEFAKLLSAQDFMRMHFDSKDAAEKFLQDAISKPNAEVEKMLELITTSLSKTPEH